MGQFPEEHPQFINEIRFRKDEFSPFFDDFLHLVKMRIFQKIIQMSEHITFYKAKKKKKKKNHLFFFFLYKIKNLKNLLKIKFFIY